MWYKLLTHVPGLPVGYVPGSRIWLNEGRDGTLLYHVWTMIIPVPRESVIAE
jgi:hypothetical protein